MNASSRTLRAVALCGVVVVVAAGFWLARRYPGSTELPSAAASPSPSPASSASPSVPGAGDSHPERAGVRGVKLSAPARDRNPIATSVVERRRLAADLELVGAATYDGDRLAIVGPLIAGRVVSLKARPGDSVRAGQVLAEIESAEVGQAAAGYLTARARARVSAANRARERELAVQHVSSIREREVAEAQAAADEAELGAAEQRLLALGLGPAEVRALASGRGRAGRVALRSPLAGVVLHRNITAGQAVEAHTDAFRVADLGHLWVFLDVFEKDLEHVHVGQRAQLRTVSLPGTVLDSVVAYIEPRIDEATRTARVRIEFENQRQLLRPGQFVTAHLPGEPSSTSEAVLAIPRSALVTVEGRPSVFVAMPDGSFARRTVELGRSSNGHVEIRTGLAAGDRVVTEGAFLLKSEEAR